MELLFIQYVLFEGVGFFITLFTGDNENELNYLYPEKIIFTSSILALFFPKFHR